MTIASLSFVPSSEVSFTFSRYPSIASKQSNNTSIRLLVTFILSLRISWNTFSISWVRRCILLNPMVPAIPFKECAARKISLITSLFSGSFSNCIMLSLRVCKCPFVSSIKISRYWLTSISLYPHILYYCLCNFSQRNNLICCTCLSNGFWHSIYHTAFCILCDRMHLFMLL